MKANSGLTKWINRFESAIGTRPSIGHTQNNPHRYVCLSCFPSNQVRQVNVRIEAHFHRCLLPKVAVIASCQHASPFVLNKCEP